MKRKNVRLDDESVLMLEKLDKKLNLNPNQNSVILLAIKRLYWEEISNGFGKRP